MSQKAQPVPPAYGAIPYLTIRNANDAIAFYQRTFGAEVVTKLADPTGAVVHAELKVGPASFMLTEERPEMGALSPQTVGGSSTTVTFFAPDCDAVFNRAVEAGCKTTMPLMDQFWGDRAGGFIDPFGHSWMVATQKETLSNDELQQRFQAAMAAMAAGGACGEGGSAG
jgi:PhnB protein